MAARGAPAAKAALAPGTARHQRAADCAGFPGPPDGERGAWRWSRAWRSLSQVAAARATRWHLSPLAPLAPSSLERPDAPLRTVRGPGTGGITPRGWAILGSGFLLALAMVGMGMALLRRGPAEAPHAGPLARTEE